MLAAYLYGARDIRLIESEPLPLRPDDVRVEVAYSGICGKQLEEISGKRGPDPYIPHLLGHAGSPWYYVPRAFAHPLWVPEPRPQSHSGGGPPRTLSVGSASASARSGHLPAMRLTKASSESLIASD